MRAALLLGSLACALRVQAQTASSGVNLNEVDTIFAFGDSYSWNGYSPLLGVNNFPGYGATSSGGYNWLQYLSTLGAGQISLYNLAAAGATTNNSIVSAPATDFANQVGLWHDWFAPGIGTARTTGQMQWDTNSTLFTIWIGINDIGMGYLQAQNFTSNLPAIFDSYSRAVAALYSGEARNFLILGVPPTYRTPMIQAYGPEIVAAYNTYVNQYNLALARLVDTFRVRYADASFALFDTVPFFSQILDHPERYGFAEVTTACGAYAALYNQPNITLPVCKWPMSEYFWWNGYHPTWTVHKLLANVIAQTLSSALPSSSSSLPSSTSSLPIPTTTLTNTLPASSASGSIAPSSTGGGSSGAGRAVGSAHRWAAAALAAAAAAGGALGGALLL